MRVATFNILHGRTVGGDVDLDRLRTSVQRLDADVLALQEVDVAQHRSGQADLTAVAAEAMGAVAHRFVAAISGTPGATWAAATGGEQPGTASYGIALLSRFPVTNWHVMRLPRVPFKVPMYLPGTDRVVVGEEPRAAMIAELDTPWGPISVGNTHLSFVPVWNRRQLRRLVTELRSCPGPRLLVGDLNLTAPAVVRTTGMRSLGQTPTYPARSPRRQLDHILTDDPRLAARRIDTPLMPISDHRPLVVDVSMGSRP